MVVKHKKTLPTVDFLEGLMLLGQVSRIGFTGTLSIGKPKISDEQYIDMVKEAVSPKN